MEYVDFSKFKQPGYAPDASAWSKPPPSVEPGDVVEIYVNHDTGAQKITVTHADGRIDGWGMAWGFAEKL